MRTIINRLIAVCPNSGRKSILKEFSNTPWMRTTLPQLSPYDVNLTLREHEYTHNFPEGCVKGYDSNQLGSNSPMEDTCTEASVLNTNAFLCGVYDGHGGSACSQVVSKRLFRYISTAIQDREHLKQVVKQGGVHSQSFVKCHNDKVDFVIEIRDIFEESYQSYLQYLLNETADTDDRVEAIINAFLHLDNHLSKEALEHSSVWKMAVAMSGTVACVGLIEGRELYLASPGDCTAVLGSVTDTGQWVTKKAESRAHHGQYPRSPKNPRQTPARRTRNYYQNERLLGQLVPLRALGDFRYKWTNEMMTRIVVPTFGESSVPPHYLSPPYLTARPDVTHYWKLQSLANTDKPCS